MFVRLLGAVGAGPDEALVSPAPGRVAAGVLAHLVLARGRLMTPQILADAVWEAPPDSARNAIQVAVSKLRRQFGAEFVTSDRAGYRISTALVRVDVTEAEQLVAEARAALSADRLADALSTAESAAGLFAGLPLAGLETSSAEAARHYAEELRTAVQILRARALLGLGRADEAVEILRAEATRDLLNETVYEYLMEALAADGRPAEALKTYDALRRRLVDELGADPSPQLNELFHRLLNPPPAPPANAQAPSSGATHRSSKARPATGHLALPPQGSPLAGRQRERTLVGDLLAGGNRLVTLLGPGGIGKTRLAVAVAQEVAANGQRSAFFVDLTAVSDASGVGHAIAAAVGVDGADFTAALRGGTSLVILDNAEHVLDAVATVAHTLLTIDGVWILTTSRRPLKLHDERAVWLEALPAQAVDDPAVRLLANKACFDRADLEVHGGELLALARRADGVPLVLELFAAELSWRTPRDLLESLDETLLDLTDPSRDRAHRHLSIHAATEWSLRQANDQARIGLSALTLIRGPFSLEAASEILAAVLPQGDVRNVLAELVDLSLVQRLAHPGRIEFRILEPIRLSALASSLVPEASAAAHLSHADHYLRRLILAEGRASDTDRPLMSVLRDDDANLKLALEWLWIHDRQSGLKFLAPLAYGWSYQSRHEDVLTWTQRALSSPSTGLARAKIALARYYTLVFLQKNEQIELEGLADMVRLFVAEFTDEWRARWGAAQCEYYLNFNDFEAALSVLDQYRPGNPGDRLHADTQRLCILLEAGRFGEAEASANDLLVHPRLRDHSVLLVRVLSNRGYAAIGQGRGAEATPFLKKALELTAAQTMAGAAVTINNNLAWASLQQSAFEDALQLLSRNLLDRFFLNDRGALIEACIIAGLAQHGLGRSSEAETLASAAAGLAAHEPATVDVFGRQQLDRLTVSTKAKPVKPDENSLIDLLRSFTASEVGTLP